MQISAISFPLTPAIRQHVQGRLESALAGSNIAYDQASVRLLDINGSRGGVDKQCRVSVPMKAAAPAVAVSTARDLYAAIDKAALRLREMIRRKHERQRTLRRAATPR